MLCSKSFAKPKSATFTPPPTSRRFCGLTSPCCMPSPIRRSCPLAALHRYSSSGFAPGASCSGAGEGTVCMDRASCGGGSRLSILPVEKEEGHCSVEILVSRVRRVGPAHGGCPVGVAPLTAPPADLFYGAR